LPYLQEHASPPHSDLPEKVTAIVDDKGIEAIRKINTATEAQLSDEDRSALAFYTGIAIHPNAKA